MKVAITGASGFLAGYMIDELLSRGDAPLLLSRDDGWRRGLPYSATDYTTCSLIQILAQGVDAIVHLAASRSVVSDVAFYMDALAMTKSLYEAAGECGVVNIVYTSSISVYSGSHLPYAEDGVAEAVNHYGLHKLMCEHVGNMASANGLCVKNLRMAHLFGANESNGYMINKFLRQAYAHEQLRVYARSEARREMLYAKDAARAICLALEHEGTRGTFNIGSGQRLTNEEIAETICAVMSPELEVLVGDDCEDIKSSYMDGDKAARVLGYEPAYSFREAVEDIYKVMKSSEVAEV